MRKIIFIDLDGTIVNFVDAALKFHGVIGDTFNWPFEYGKFDINELIGISKDEFLGPLGFDFWSNLDWTIDGKQIFFHFIKKYGRESICILSNDGNNQECREGKIEWIRRNLPSSFYEEKKYLWGSRKDFCAHENSILVDDKDMNVLNFVYARGRGVTVPRPWNCEWKNFKEGHYWIDDLEINLRNL